jgi:hypothetical protein
MRPPKRKSKVTPVFEWTSISSFLNVDLLIRSRYSLEPLLKEWGKIMARIPDAKPAHKAHWIVVNLRWQPKTAEATIRALLRLVNKLSRRGRYAWKNASSRIFDIGIQAGITQQSFEEVQLSRSTLRELARLDGSILVTVYAPDPEVVQKKRKTEQ